MTLHPSRTERHTMKIRELATGLVIERQPPDARACVEHGTYEYVDADVPSVSELLQSKSAEQLRELLLTADLHAHPHERPDGMIAQLLPLVESGAVALS